MYIAVGTPKGPLAPRMASGPFGMKLRRGQEALAFSSTFGASAATGGFGAGLAAS